MPSRRVNPNRVKLHRSYSVEELARCLDVHKNTVRNWQAKGLEPIDKVRPLLFHGQSVRAFLVAQNSSRKQPCPAGTIYCFRCREPRKPALGVADYIARKPYSGNLRAVCGVCESTMHRSVREADIASVMPGCTVQFTHGPSSLIGKPGSSLNCDLKGAR